MIYFDNAATTFPKPQSVQNAVREAMWRYGANPGRSGHQLAIETSEQVYRCRERAAVLFGAEPEQVVFTKNCTEALNIVMKGLIRQGDHLIISDLEHNAVARVAQRLQDDKIAQYDIATTVEDAEQTVLNFEALIRPNTRMIVCTQGSNVFGIRLPTEQIGQMARRHQLLMVVDAAQTAGLVNINLKVDPIDYLCMPGHKGLYGPSGTGMLLINHEELPKPLMEGGTGSASMELAMPDFLPDRLESGTVNTAGIIGLRAGIDYVIRHTPDALYRQEMKLTDWIYRNLQTIPAVILYTERPCLGKSLPVLSFNIEGYDSMQTAEQLSQLGIGVRAGFQCARLAHIKMGTAQTGTTRISLGSYNTPEEAATLLRRIRWCIHH